jgi:hypothetical protein
MYVLDARGAMQLALRIATLAPTLRKRAAYVAPVARKTNIAWWEFESDVKRHLALEILMRKMFAIMPKAA